MAEIPQWRLAGDWFDVCRCRVPCGCTFAQAPDEGQCDGILAWHVREGNYGDVELDDMNVVAVGSFEGNIWAGEAKPASVTLEISAAESAGATRGLRGEYFLM